MAVNRESLRKILFLVLGLLVIFLGILWRNSIVANKEQPQIRENNSIQQVYVQKVKNQTIPIEISETGNLQALRKVELFSEVQGVLEAGNKLFRPGQSYGKGELILSIDDAEFLSSLTAQKSVLYNLITQAMPDLKLDYPEAFPQWQSYLENFDITQPLSPFPEFKSEKEKFFINSRNIITTYYNILNLEERLSKYTIEAPFYSVVTEALVFPGTLVRPGQKLGTIINPTLFEMMVSVDESYQEYITVGKKVTLYSLGRNNSWEGKIARIDPTVNTQTQGVKVYIELSGKDLKEGMFLEAVIEGKAIVNSYEISRKLLVENDQIYVVRGDSLALVPAEIAFYKDKTALITNLRDNTLILKNPVPGAYEGMEVKIITEGSELNKQ